MRVYSILQAGVEYQRKERLSELSHSGIAPRGAHTLWGAMPEENARLGIEK